MCCTITTEPDKVIEYDDEDEDEDEDDEDEDSDDPERPSAKRQKIGDVAYLEKVKIILLYCKGDTIKENLQPSGIFSFLPYVFVNFVSFCTFFVSTCEASSLGNLKIHSSFT